MDAAAKYSDPRSYSKIGRVRTALIYPLDGHRIDDALPTSVRFLLYKLVMRRESWGYVSLAFIREQSDRQLTFQAGNRELECPAQAQSAL